MSKNGNFLDIDHQISLDSIVRVLNQEIQWCYAHPMEGQITEEFRNGFIKGIEQAKYLIIKCAEVQTKI